MRRMVILGGSGFMGQNLLRRIPTGQWQTLVYDRNPPRFHQPGRFIRGDLAEIERVSALVEPNDVVIHLAHQGLPADFGPAPAGELQLNLYPFLRLLPALASRQPALFLYSSTGGQIYGHAPHLPLTEESPTRPISAYGVVKLAMEQFLRLFAPTRSLPFVVVRISNPYGPYQEACNRHGVIPAIMRALLADQPFTLYGRGDTVRDYIHVDDVISAFLQLIESGARNQVFNVGTGRGTSLSDLIARIEQIAGKKLRRNPVAIRSTDVLANVLDSSRLKQAVGWKPQINLDFGLSLTWEYLKHHAHG